MIRGLAAIALLIVAPETSRGGAVERYTIRVPTEGKVTTTALDLDVPADVTITGVVVTGGFTYEARREGDRIVGITWHLDVKPSVRIGRSYFVAGFVAPS